MRVLALYKIDLPLTDPVLERLLALDRRFDVAERCVVDEDFHTVTRGEFRADSRFMCLYATQ